MPIAPEYLHLVHPGPMPALLYGRSSRDPKKKGRSVADQIGSGRDLCAEHGWPIAAVFDQDVDRSASRHAKRTRADFEALLDAIEAGMGRIVVAFEASRYYRDVEVYIRLRNACISANVLLCHNGQVYDLSKREDRKLTAQDAIAAEDEGEGIRERNLRTTRAQAKKGAPHGRILYGYARRYDPDTGDLVEQYKHPEHAAIVLKIFKDIAALRPQYSIVAELKKQGPRLPDIEWRQDHVASMVRNPAYMGRRMHNGQDAAKAAWPAIVSPELFAQVQEIVRNPDRLTTTDRSVKHLLSGVARCGECPEDPHVKVIKNRGYLSYTCSAKFNTSIEEVKCDAYVEEAVLTWLSSKAAASAMRSTGQEEEAEAARLRLVALRRQLDDARAAAVEFTDDGTPRLSVESLAAMEGRLLPMIEKARQESAFVEAPPVVRRLVSASNTEAVWNGLTIEQRRKVLRHIVNIRVHAAGTGVRTIKPGRITLVFVGQPGFKSSWRRDLSQRGARADESPGEAPDQ